MYPAGHHVAWWGKIPEVDHGRAAPGPEQHRWLCGVAACFQPDDRHLVCLASICRLKCMVHGPPQDSIGTVLEQLEGWDISVTPGEHCCCAYFASASAYVVPYTSFSLLSSFFLPSLPVPACSPHPAFLHLPSPFLLPPFYLSSLSFISPSTLLHLPSPSPFSPLRSPSINSPTPPHILSIFCCISKGNDVTDTARHRLRPEIPRSGTDSYCWLSHLGVHTPYATRRKPRYEANQVNTTFILQGSQSWGKLAVETWRVKTELTITTILHIIIITTSILDLGFKKIAPKILAHTKMHK